MSNDELAIKIAHKDIFDEIEAYSEKTRFEFIEFILNRHPPNTSPLKKNQVIRQAWDKNAKNFCVKLSARYNPDCYYPRDTEEEKLRFTIMSTISTKLNEILSGFSAEKYYI